MREGVLSAGTPARPQGGLGAGGLSATAARAWLPWAAFAAAVAFGFFLTAWDIAASGLGNTYYAAAVRSMTASWKNFFFAAFDPGGFISVDKPPVFLWVEALSARLFGYSSWSLLLPSAVAGAASVVLVGLTVRRFGVLAAVIAGLVMALTPIWVAVHRLNLPEPFYVLADVAAAGCVLGSLQSRRWFWWTAAAGLLVGVAFNSKMLAAWIPGPALALAIVAGVAGPWRTVWRQWAARLTVLAAATFIASGSWMTVVDLWPESDRPYVGGSRDNTVWDLVLGYNGLDRIEGDTGALAAPPGRAPAPAVPNPAGFRGAGGVVAGSPGTLRMFDVANGAQIGWLLPFALAGAALALWRWRWDVPLRAAVVLWLGWVLLFAGVFSYSKGIYHSYYTAAMVPGIGALVGIGVVAAADLIRRHGVWTLAAVALAAVSAWAQLSIAGRFPGFYGWLRPFMVAAVVAGAVLVIVSLRRRRLSPLAGLSLMVAGLLLLPAAWSTYETAHAAMNTTLPQAGPRQGFAGRTFGSNAFDSGLVQLADWLEARGGAGTRWDLAVTSAMNASRLMAEHDLSVMAIGGFMGRDPTITVREFAELVAAGEVRYVLVTGGPVPVPMPAPQFTPGGGRLPQGGFPPPASLSVPQQAKGATPIMTAVRSACTPVTDWRLPAQYRGSLYDCSGRAALLAR